MSTGRPRISFGEQRENVVQLLRDRKNGVGGYCEGIKDFAEMGPHQGGEWPLSAESIKRAFGVPKDRDNPDDSSYVLTLRAQSHLLLENKLWMLRTYAYQNWQAVNALYPLDGAGDRDYEWYAKRARWTTPTKVLKEKGLYESAIAARGLVTCCNLGIYWLTEQMLDEELFVEFAQRRTIKEEEKLEKMNMEIYLRYKQLTGARPDGYGMSVSDAHGQMIKEPGYAQGMHPRSISRIVESKEMEVEGRPKRGKGRPKKKVR